MPYFRITYPLERSREGKKGCEGCSYIEITQTGTRYCMFKMPYIHVGGSRQDAERFASVTWNLCPRHTEDGSKHILRRRIVKI